MCVFFLSTSDIHSTSPSLEIFRGRSSFPHFFQDYHDDAIAAFLRFRYSFELDDIYPFGFYYALRFSQPLFFC